MSRKIKIDLPKYQSVCFNNKVLWELIRIDAQLNSLSISEYVEIAVNNFYWSNDKARLIEMVKVSKAMKNEQE